MVRTTPVVDVHQHLWTPELLDALRARSRPPYVGGWTLHAPGQPPYDIDPSTHEPPKRAAQAADDGVDHVLLSLSSPLGIEWLPEADADSMIDVWHDSALALGEPYAVWAAASMSRPDADRVTDALDRGCVGLQIPADALGTPKQLDRLAPVLAACAGRNKPVLVHPGPTPASAAADAQRPSWWTPVVDYPSQLAAAWWAWHVAGRGLAPTLRICFVAGAGLAPVHHERLVARGGRFGAVDAEVFVDTSSYGPRGLDAVIRVLGIDTVVLGSDRPYAEPTDPGLGDAATFAIRRTNPQRLLKGGER